MVLDKKDRVPPGQTLTDRWPVLHAGTVPRVNLDAWTFRIFGLVDEEKILTYREFMSLPQTRVQSDIHCVTTWSRLDNTWDGVLFKDVMNLVKVKSEAKFVMVHAEEGWTTNLPLEDLLYDNVLFAHKHDGVDLTPNHGWPLRLVVPHLYFWKSAKWVRGIEFMAEDRPGFWEERGYHLYADPWLEQRYRDDPEWNETGRNTEEYYRTIKARVRKEMAEKQRPSS
ncbi:sulfite oxidase-like oxidoreductase [Effusibacillus lacus]|uniref:Oxidoreductase n=1 Tax=Effusibacillus lacus TaxID=1348429 RepID=A0A292YSX2_9BACL|nr:sulfite oxidase-like oxidoreductase [Effusibacillus lacus]TCS74912.1 DMSO/TMAO reductase YedYZ molybdopterin-dependent catalytic subunit [Effusibacillus lacus]GAX91585.1 oxidoreductase [Effusibacillus lacus]